MPTLGNHEIEAGNGPLGYNAYHTRYSLPGNGSSSFNGNWYSYQAGSVLFIALDNNDVVYENAGGAYYNNPNNGPYIRGYSHGAQERWLARTLQAGYPDPRLPPGPEIGICGTANSGDTGPGTGRLRFAAIS
jgi:hypothetical protein